MNIDSVRSQFSALREKTFHVLNIKDAIEWVDSPEEATADYEKAAVATQEKLLKDLGVGNKTGGDT